MLEVDIETNSILFSEPLIMGESCDDCLSPTNRRSSSNVHRRHNHFFVAHFLTVVAVLLTLAGVVFFAFYPFHYNPGGNDDDFDKPGNGTNNVTATAIDVIKQVLIDGNITTSTMRSF